MQVRWLSVEGRCRKEKRGCWDRAFLKLDGDIGENQHALPAFIFQMMPAPFAQITQLR
jgi:hypothetical protein